MYLPNSPYLTLQVFCKSHYSKMLFCKWILLKLKFSAWLYCGRYVLTYDLIFQNLPKFSTGTVKVIFYLGKSFWSILTVEAECLELYCHFNAFSMNIRTTCVYRNYGTFLLPLNKLSFIDWYIYADHDIRLALS